MNGTQAEAFEMVSAQVIGDDVVTGIGEARGYQKMKVYKPLIIFDIAQRH